MKTEQQDYPFKIGADNFARLRIKNISFYHLIDLLFSHLIDKFLSV